MSPSLVTHPLHRADGSATLTTRLTTLHAAATGPIEVQRRDELPEEAAIDVHVRPSSGPGGPRERWVEGVLARLLREVVLVGMFPRTCVQVTLLVVKEAVVEKKGGMRGGVRDVVLVAGAVNAAFAALVDAGIPLAKTVVGGLGVVGREGEVVVEPEEKDVLGCRSVHAVVFSMSGEVLLAESAGRFGVEEWGRVVERLREVALGAVAKDGEDEAMEGGDEKGGPWLRQKLEEEVRAAGAWRESG